MRELDALAAKIDLMQPDFVQLSTWINELSGGKPTPLIPPRLLLAALRHLPLELQLILELHYWEDLSTSEMAEVVGIPQGTVKSRLRRAREQLTAQIAAHDADPTLIQTTLQNLEGWARELREQQG